MKINDILLEKPDIHPRYIRIAESLRNSCKPFLEQIDYKVAEYPLFRGTKYPQKRKFENRKTHYTGRKPKDSTQREHDGMNKAFVEMFGIPFRDALFLTGDYDTATNYSSTSPFVIFPVGFVDFVWSDEIADLWSAWQESQMSSDLLDFVEKNGSAVSPTGERFHEWLEMANYVMNENLKDAIKSGHEIMLRCKNYYRFQIKNPRITNTRFIQNSVKKVGKTSDIGKFYSAGEQWHDNKKNNLQDFEIDLGTLQQILTQ